MIERYTLPKMKEIWSDEKRFQTWLRIELLACEAHVNLGIIPKEALNKIKEKAEIDVKRINEIEATTKHDVIAFLTQISEKMGDESRFIHQGLTSSDILDTSLAVLMRDASEIIIDDIKRLLLVLKEKAIKYKDTTMIGRSHGIHGEPITFGIKLAIWYEETKRNLDRMIKAKEEISYGMISGAMGTFAHCPPQVEEYVCKEIGLHPDPVSNQIIQRDRHAYFLATLAIIASSLDKFATEIRHLQRTEVLEAQEYFSKGQKGSSAMPHKRNPIGCENISGLARLIRSNSIAAMENVALWHERDISHSSVERVIIPDSTILIDFMLNRFTDIINKLIVYPENMIRNLDLTSGLIYSQRVLLMLTDKGVKREDAYRIVQDNAMKAWDEGTSFKELIKKDEEIKNLLNQDEINKCFDPKYYLQHTDYIYKRVFGESEI